LTVVKIRLFFLVAAAAHGFRRFDVQIGRDAYLPTLLFTLHDRHYG
jgi:hypothetical protein